jgi:hypothetical protein
MDRTPSLIDFGATSLEGGKRRMNFDQYTFSSPVASSEVERTTRTTSTTTTTTTTTTNTKGHVGLEERNNDGITAFSAGHVAVGSFGKLG